MLCTPREEIRSLKPAFHGGVLDEHLLDFSIGVNPFPPAPEVMEAFRTADIGRYPDSSSQGLRMAVAHSYGLDAEEILVANGTSQALWLIAMTYLRATDQVLTFSPGYGDYATASRIMGAGVREYRLMPERDFRPEESHLHEEIQRLRPRIVWLCNPSNPTGVYLEEDLVLGVLKETSAYGGILVLDEAYLYFVRDIWNSCKFLKEGNLVVARSMTKDFGIPGLRLGYLAARKEIISQIVPVQPPWSVNTPAQEAGIAALSHIFYYQREWEKVGILTRQLASGLQKLGFYVVPSSSNFLMFRTDPQLRIAARLKEYGIIVRDCTSFGLPGYIRIGTRREEDNLLLLEKLTQLSGREQNF